MSWEDIVVNMHFFFLESCSQKRGIEGASDKKKGAKKGIKFVGWRRLALFVWGNN